MSAKAASRTVDIDNVKGIYTRCVVIFDSANAARGKKSVMRTNFPSFFRFSVVVLAAISDLCAGQAYLQFNVGDGAPINGWSTLSAADRTPNATHEVPFNLSTAAAGQDWTFELRISDVKLPNHTTGNPPKPNAHVAYISYHIGWSSDQGLDEAVADALDISPESDVRRQSCLTLFDIHFPQETSNRWQNNSSDCTSALGEECVRSVMDAFDFEDDCSQLSVNLSNHTACQDAFVPVENGFAYTSRQFGNLNDSSDVDMQPQSGGSVAWVLSDPYAPGNVTAFDAAKSQMRMIALANAQGTQLLCNRVASASAGERRTPVGIVSFVSLAALVLAVKASL